MAPSPVLSISSKNTHPCLRSKAFMNTGKSNNIIQKHASTICCCIAYYSPQNRHVFVPYDILRIIEFCSIQNLTE